MVVFRSKNVKEGDYRFFICHIIAQRFMRELPSQGSRSYAFRIDFFAEALLAHLNKTKSCEVEVVTGESEIDVIHVAAGALATEWPSYTLSYKT